MTFPDDLELDRALRRAVTTIPVDVDAGWRDLERRARRTWTHIALWVAVAALVIVASAVPIRLLAGAESSLDVTGDPGTGNPVSSQPTTTSTTPVAGPPDLRDVDIQGLLSSVMPPTFVVTGAAPPDGAAGVQRFDVGPARLTVSQEPGAPGSTSEAPPVTAPGGVPGASSWRTVGDVEVELVVDPTSVTPSRVVQASFSCGRLRWTFSTRQGRSGEPAPDVEAIAVEIAGLLPCS